MLVLKHATKAQLLAEFRQRYRSATGYELWRLSAKLRGWVVANDITNAQLTAATGLSGADLTAFKQRVSARADKWDAMIAEVGE